MHDSKHRNGTRPQRSRRTSVTAVLGALAAVALAVSACTVPPDPTEPSITVASSIGGFDRPWELVFLPDGTPLVTERPGRIAAVVGGARKVVATIGDVVASGEGGLLGLAVDPDFATNRRIYTCYDHGSSGAVTDVRIVRFRVAEDLGSLTDPTPILTGIPHGAGNRHQGCRLAFGPDSMLWATTGDAAQPTYPQLTTNLAGKVLRLTRDGAPAPGNPGSPWNPYVYSIGHRNGQGLTFRPTDGAAFEVEHGTGCDDEVNLLAPGANYGWDPVPPGGGTTYDESRPMTDLTKFPTARVAVWSSGCPTIAPSGAGFLSGTQWRDWNGSLAVAVLKGTQLRVFTFDAAGAVTAQASGVTDQGRLRVAVQGPDGDLFVAQDADPGAVLRVHPS